MSKSIYKRGKYDSREGGLNCAHPFPRRLGYNRGSDITKVKGVHTCYYKTVYAFTSSNSSMCPSQRGRHLAVASHTYGRPGISFEGMENDLFIMHNLRLVRVTLL